MQDWRKEGAVPLAHLTSRFLEKGVAMAIVLELTAGECDGFLQDTGPVSHYPAVYGHWGNKRLFLFFS